MQTSDVEGMTNDIMAWRVFCEHCEWNVPDCGSRDLATQIGRSHVKENHENDDEWSFRVQGIKRGEAMNIWEAITENVHDEEAPRAVQDLEAVSAKTTHEPLVPQSDWDEAVALYEALAQNAEDNGTSYESYFTAAARAGISQNYSVRKAWGYLLSWGCTVTISKREKRLLIHPHDKFGDQLPPLTTKPHFPSGKKRATPAKPAKVREAAPTVALALRDLDHHALVDVVGEERLAGALAEGMWTRYEWTLTEIGRLREEVGRLTAQLAVRDEELRRFRQMFHEYEPSVSDLARRMLDQD